MSRRTIALAGGSLFAMMLLATLSLAHAKAAGPDGAVQLSPAFQEIIVKSNETRKTFSLKATNTSSSVAEYRVSALDFKSLNESGGVAFVGAKPSELERKYGLASWVILEKDSITIAPGETSTVRVDIDNRQSLAPGGHYGAILLTRVNTDNDTKQNQVQLHQVLASLMLMKKEGGEVYGLSLGAIVHSGDLWRLPEKPTLRFQNTGNVHVVPRGTVTITDPIGRTVARGVINAESAFILPESFRKFTTPLIVTNRPYIPGNYRMTVNYRYEGSDQLKTQEVAFMWLNLPDILVLALILTSTVGLIYWRIRRIKHKRK